VTDPVVEKGYSKEFGARNMERAFHKLVLEPLAVHLCGPKRENRKKLIAERKGDEVVFGES